MRKSFQKGIPRQFKFIFHANNSFRMPFIFNHIFKTAGTTFNHSYLPVAFPTLRQQVISGLINENSSGIRQMELLSEFTKRQLGIIAGHNTELLRGTFKSSKFLTLIREPVSRAVSAYLHAKYHPDMRRYLNDAIINEKISLSEFVETDYLAKNYARFCSIHDYQFKILCEYEEFHGRGNISNDELSRAFKRYAVIGLTEDFERFLGILHFRYGFPLIMFTNQLVRKERSQFVVSKKEVDLILHYNRADARLYEMARELFNSEWNHVYRPVRDGQVWNSYLEKLFEFRKENSENQQNSLSAISVR